MRPTEDLIREHKAIKVMLRIMKNLADSISAGNEVDTGDIKDIIHFLKVFADQCHHGKEETALFPALVAAGLPEKSGPIAVMLEDHTIGRKYIKEIEIALAGHVTGQPNIPLADGLIRYVNHLHGHILKEDSILFPMADRMLNEDRQTELNILFDKTEKDVIGQGVHEQFEALLERLDKKY
jgi:hemerythrin-like domain-containing protein